MADGTDVVIRELRDARAFAKMIGEAPSFIDAIAAIRTIASSTCAVLITGETGTGKELVARAIHFLSKRAGRPLVCENCGSLPDALAHDALVAHEPGAFTHARARMDGR